MAEQKRTAFKLPGPGPYIARITNHLDPTYMGGVEAVLEKGTINDPEYQNYTFPLQYLSPFYGITADVGNAKQTSYGMWFVPPDIGTRVVCIFVQSDSSQGFWIGCIGERYQNHMIPGIAASENVDWLPGEYEQYGSAVVPVTEFKKSKVKTPNPHAVPKPVHPFARRLKTQGLLSDTVRGITNSSARREYPSSVFGILTPGPLNAYGEKRTIGYKDPGLVYTPAERLSGHQFVMDDGDLSGRNRLFRLRTGAGHQVLLNDSDNVLYIANANGTAWLEFSASGKIDVYAEDSISIHSKQDFNFRADRDINLEAIRNVNIKSVNNITLNADKEYNLRVLSAGKIYIEGNLDQYIKNDYNTTVQGNINFLTNSRMNITGKQDLSLTSQGKIYAASSGGIKQGKPGTIAEVATAAVRETTQLKNWYIPTTGGAEQIPSVMQRVPMHEPWTQHESLTAPFSPETTDARNIVAAIGEKPSTIYGSEDEWFESGTSTLTTKGKTDLTQFTDKLKAKGGAYALTIETYYDDTLSPQASQILTVNRSNAIKEFFTVKGLPEKTIQAIGKGSASPVAPNKFPDGKPNLQGQKDNRRVVIKITPIAAASGNSANNSVPRMNPNSPLDWAKDQPFLDKVKQVATKYKMDWIDLLAVMHFESGVNPAQPNKAGSGAMGLIQFMPKTARDLGTTTAQLATMTRVQQMEWVDRYMNYVIGGKIKTITGTVTLDDVYMSVLCPRAFGKPPSEFCYSDRPEWLARFKDEKVRAQEAENYRQNQSLDVNGDRAITKVEASSKVYNNKAIVKRALGIS